MGFDSCYHSPQFLSLLSVTSWRAGRPLKYLENNPTSRTSVVVTGLVIASSWSLQPGNGLPYRVLEEQLNTPRRMAGVDKEGEDLASGNSRDPVSVEGYNIGTKLDGCMG
jgi:hypothetical protein